MKRRVLETWMVVGFLVVGLVACSPGGSNTAGSTADQASQQQATSTTGTRTGGTGARTGTTGTQTTGTTGSTFAAPTASATSATSSTLDFGNSVSGIGEVKAEQDANLSFAVQGTVDQVLVKEGDVVTKGQTLAILDTRSFDQKVEAAQAALDIAVANQTALTEAPNAATVNAASAQVRQAQIAVAQAGVSQPESIRNAQAVLTQAQANLQAQRDQLSRNKTNAEQIVQQDALALQKAQAAYATAKSDWDFVNGTDKNPSNPDTTNPQTGKKTPNKVNNTQREQYYQTFVQAEAALHQAETALQQAQVDAEQARQAEVTGIQASEQQVTQSQTSLNKLNLPSSVDQVASARATLDQARANLAKVYPSPTGSDKAKASANIRSAQAQLDGAKLDREHAELKAPFDGVVVQVNINPGDPSSSAGTVPIYLVDVSKLHVDVNISDVDIGRVSVGQKAQMYADAAPEKVYTGSISYIAPAATVTNNIRTYVVRILLDNQEGLRAGMSIRVEIPTK